MGPVGQLARDATTSREGHREDGHNGSRGNCPDQTAHTIYEASKKTSLERAPHLLVCAHLCASVPALATMGTCTQQGNFVSCCARLALLLKLILPVATLMSVLPLLVARVASCTVSLSRTLIACTRWCSTNPSAPGELGPHRRTWFHAAVVSSAYHAEVCTLAQPWPQPAGPGRQFACLRVVKAREPGKPGNVCYCYVKIMLQRTRSLAVRHRQAWPCE